MQGKDIILGMLNQGAKTGYEINEVLKNQLSYFYDGSYGMIYPTLKKLENEQLVEKTDVVQVGKPNKKVYAITEAGRTAFNRYLYSPIANDIHKSDYLMRLFFGDTLNHDDLKQIIQTAIDAKTVQLNQLQAGYAHWQQQHEVPLNKQLTIKCGLNQFECEIHFLKRLIKTL